MIRLANINAVWTGSFVASESLKYMQCDSVLRVPSLYSGHSYGPPRYPFCAITRQAASP